MVTEDRYRARTLFEYAPEKDGVIPYIDTCYIFRDGETWIALSLDTSKVCEGESAEEAYVNLVVSIVRAIRHFHKVSPDKRLVLGTEQPKSMQEESLTGHRFEKPLQESYLNSALLLLQNDASKPFVDTALHYEKISEETAHGYIVLDYLEEPGPRIAV